jgi:MFS family permease
LTIPSALTLIVHVFTDRGEQARALGVFGGTAAFGNIIGVIIGAIFVQYASWRWVFWFVAIVSLPIAAVCFFLIPRVTATEVRSDRFKSLDVPGVSILTAALLLFIFAVTSSAENGWGSAIVLAPLLISLALAGGFFFWETIVPENRAAM